MGGKIIKASSADRKAFGERVAKAREAAGFETQHELAEQMGVRSQTVHFWENGHNMPFRARLNELAQILGVRKQWLETGEGEMVAETQKGAVASPPSAKQLRQALREACEARAPSLAGYFGQELKLGGMALEMDYASPQGALLIAEFSPRDDVAQIVRAALWKLAVIQARDHWLGARRKYFLALISPSYMFDLSPLYHQLQQEAELFGLELWANPRTEEIAEPLFREEDG